MSDYPDFKCFLCSKDVTRDQWHDGTVFTAFGNYGSGLFDPMDGAVNLTIIVCDPCLESRAMTVQYVTEDRPPSTYTYKPWNPKTDLRR